MPSEQPFIFHCNIFLENGDIIIDGTKIEPKQLCELGGEKIIVPLNVSCPKKGKITYIDNFK
jgi:hypothetical protein